MSIVDGAAPEPKRRRSAMRRYVALDLETTGFDTEAKPRNFPTQLAAVLVGHEGPQTLCCEFVRGAERIAAWALKNTRVTLEDTNGGRDIGELLRDLATALEPDDVLVFHNKNYDWDKVLRLYAPTDVLAETLGRHEIRCSASGNMYQCLFPGKKYPKLEELCGALGVQYDAAEAHSALYDATVLARCIGIAMSRGIHP